MRPLLLLIFLIFSQTPALAQAPMFQRLSFPVVQDGKALRYPFAGGLNAPQLSAADLNQDGIQDLVIFDRAGDVLLTFLNGGKPNETDYVYAPDYACYFPRLFDYVLLRDFNGDGAADIFTASDVPGSQELEVFQGYYEGKILKFKQFYFRYPTCPTCNPLHIYFPSTMPGFWNNLPIVKTDYPEVDDIDGDGDLDILTFAATVGGNVWWLRNTSVESGWGRDSLKFVLQDRCWGRFYESGQVRCKNSLSMIATECADSLRGPLEDRSGDPTRHPGSTVMTYDQDGNGTKEVVLGDVSFNCLNMMTNGGTPSEAWMVAQDTAFPIYDVPVDLPVFPAAFYLDLDNDGRKDMAVAPNVKTLSEDINCLWWYKNTAPAPNHKFELQTKSLFVNEMVDLGYGSRPAVADVNGDGLLDIVVGNYGTYGPNSKGTYASLYLYLNVGTAEAPQFSLVDRNWLNMAEFAPDNDYDFSPTFGDIDGDLDLDLIVGSNLGWLFCYRNFGGLGNPMVLERDFAQMWQDIEIGISSTPVIFDLDGDGLNDIISGARKGNLSFLKNIGSSVTEPKFAPNPTSKTLGSVNTLQLGNSFGWSAPAILPTPTGNLLVTGTSDGNLMVYSNLSATAGAVFPKTDNALGNVLDGDRTHPVFADLDSDGLLELLLGNQRGGLSLFRTELKDCTVSAKTATPRPAQLTLSPNPARAWVRAELPGATHIRWRAMDALGREMAAGNASNGMLNISVEGWPQGVYVVEATAAGQRAVGKVVVR